MIMIMIVSIIFMLIGISCMLKRISDKDIINKIHKERGSAGLGKIAKPSIVGIFYLLGYGFIFFSIGLFILSMEIISLFF